jgi:hypothetical protein
MGALYGACTSPCGLVYRTRAVGCPEARLEAREGSLSASLSRTRGGSEMTKQKEHKVTLIMNGYRYIAVEENGVIHLSRDGNPVGKATWTKDQLIYNSALLPDDVSSALEKKIKEQMDKNWEED